MSSAPRFKRIISGKLAAGMILTAASFGAIGQDFEPRAYANTPIGLNFLLSGYGYMAGGVATDPALPIQDADVEAHSSVFAFAQSVDVFGKSGKFDVVVPYAWVAGSARAGGQFRDRDVSGFADPRFHLSVNLYGAPALSIDEYRHYQQDTIVGASVEVSAPGGQYDSDKILNIGTNRWSIKPEIGVSKRVGPLTLEAAGGIRFYTDNDNFFGGQLREQAPIYSVQGHLIYSFNNGIWAALDGTFYTGGQTTVNGEVNDDRLQNSRVGVTLVMPVNRNNSVKLYFSTGVSARTGSDFDAGGIVWQYRFGGGF